MRICLTDRSLIVAENLVHFSKTSEVGALYGRRRQIKQSKELVIYLRKCGFR